jgi:putative transposase
MPRKSYRPEDIIAKLRLADVLLGQGKKVAEVVKALGVSEVTYYRWRQEYGGMSVSQARRLKELERENARLRRAVADLTLDEQILKEAAEGNF